MAVPWRGPDITGPEIQRTIEPPADSHWTLGRGDVAMNPLRDQDTTGQVVVVGAAPG